jgi:hypothetical protein
VILKRKMARSSAARTSKLVRNINVTEVTEHKLKLAASPPKK